MANLDPGLTAAVTQLYVNTRYQGRSFTFQCILYLYSNVFVIFILLYLTVIVRYA